MAAHLATVTAQKAARVTVTGVPKVVLAMVTGGPKALAMVIDARKVRATADGPCSPDSSKRSTKITMAASRLKN